MNLLVTGSTGFVGAALLKEIKRQEWTVTSVIRSSKLSLNSDYIAPSIDSNTNWSGAFEGIDCVVHCAARVHQMKESKADAIKAYRETNTEGTLNLARQAAQAGVKRFVFVSSIKVNGEFTKPNQPFTPDLTHAPDDPYGLSKYEAEVQLQQLAKETGLEVVIIRPPLVYGPGVKANFLSMIRWVEKGIPLPLGAIDNRRSLVYLDNLVDFMLTCCIHPKAAGETFLVSDGEDVSTTQLLNAVASGMNKSSRLLPIPMSFIDFSAKLIGKPQLSQRLCGNLQVDSSKAKALLGWSAPISFEEGIQRTVDTYLESK
ncbi:UDP-glucose 4-epimerase family protein [Vibrio hepatarius]|uniref:UDP-glucose 4-epimerase family protein n=1 Tax=Vibrio hepatarius TaxID=171383 RepID=UPI0037358D4F